jgi:hypothetical protein
MASYRSIKSTSFFNITHPGLILGLSSFTIVPPLLFYDLPSFSVQLLTHSPESSLGHLLWPPNCLPPRPPEQTHLSTSRLGEIHALGRRRPSQRLYLRTRQCVVGDWMGIAAYARGPGG